MHTAVHCIPRGRHDVLPHHQPGQQQLGSTLHGLINPSPLPHLHCSAQLRTSGRPNAGGVGAGDGRAPPLPRKATGDGVCTTIWPAAAGLFAALPGDASAPTSSCRLSSACCCSTADRKCQRSQLWRQRALMRWYYSRDRSPARKLQHRSPPTDTFQALRGPSSEVPFRIATPPEYGST